MSPVWLPGVPGAQTRSDTLLALPDLECVDLPLQLSGVDQAP